MIYTSMSLEEMQKKLDIVIYRKEAAKRAKLEEAKKQMLSKMETITKHRFELKQLVPVLQKFCIAYPNAGKEHIFTDAWAHKLGFTDSYTYFGVAGGGASGNSCYIKLQDGKFSTTSAESDVGCLEPDVFAETYCQDHDVAAKIIKIAEGLEVWLKSIRLMVEEYIEDSLNS